jgi:hypothetical protein
VLGTVEFLGHQFPVPGQDRFRSHNPGHLLQRLAAQALANFGQGHALGVAQTEPPFDLVPENAVFLRQIFVSGQEFFVHRTCDIGQ